MDVKKYEYGIVTENELLTESSRGQNQRTALQGQIVKVDAILANKKCTVRFLKDGETWESTAFTCSLECVQSVDERIWPFLAAVASPLERVKLAKNKQRVQNLLHVTTDMVIGFNDDDNVHLGIVKFIGNVRGIGKCYGIQLHEKKQGNNCDGSCAGIQYFHCLRGYGLFTTIEKLVLHHIPHDPTANSLTEVDSYIQKNISRISVGGNEERESNGIKQRQSNYFKSSHSLQDILDENTVNTNNDFDQNTIVQADNTYLIHRNGQARPGEKTRPEFDLIEVIGNWSGTTEPSQMERFSNYNKFVGDISNSNNSKVKNVNSMVNGGKTVNRKSKLTQDRSVVKYPNSKFYVNDLELSEKRPVPSTSQQSEKTFYEPNPSETNDLTVGSLVEVSNDVSDGPLYGVVRWMGKEAGASFVLVGVELEEEPVQLPLSLTDGVYYGQRMFECNADRALFVPIGQCHKDSRFQDGTPTPVHSITEKMFGKDCPIIPGSIPPIIMKTEEDVEAVCGKFRGIQGHHNSCYLDATLFAMFTYTAVFDSLLFRPKNADDIPHYEEVQRVLKEEIVNPLRTKLFVRADRVMTLRKLLDQLSSVSGLTSEEKDPEEFLNSLLAQILRAEPFLKLNSGQESYYYQLFMEKDDELKLPTVQQLFEQSFLTSDIKLKEVPSCLIVQMPRFGKSYKMYPRILPSQLLDVTDIIENSPRQCTVCGKLASWECRECFGECGVGLESTAFCTQCLEVSHAHKRRAGHKPKPLKVPQDFLMMADHCPPPRLYMELFAVVCIETSHYVAFVKCGVGHEAPWCFFDSMADRKGERNGYNIPEMVACPDISKWLSDEQTCRSLHENSPQDRHLPEHARRLLCDAYICMYQSSDVMMYS